MAGARNTRQCCRPPLTHARCSAACPVASATPCQQSCLLHNRVLIYIYRGRKGHLSLEGGGRCVNSMIQSRNYFAPVGFADFESPHKPRQPSQVRRSLTGSFSGPISDEELKQSFHAMRQSSTSQTTHPTAVFNPTAQTTHPTAAFNPTAPNSQLNDDVGVGIYFVKNEREGHFFVQKLLPGYSAEMCGSISTGDIVTHVGAYKIPPELTLDKLRPLIVRLRPAPTLRVRQCLRLIQSTGWASGHMCQPHFSTRV